MKKKILGIILIFMLTGIMFILTGCGNNDENSSSSKSGASREGLKVGDYVAYQYDDADNYIIETEYSGYSSSQEISQENLRFVIYNIDEETGRVDLISSAFSNKKIYLDGVRGYNNAVYLLNDLCASLYSNSELGITARSINIEDVENQMNDAGTEAILSYSSTDDYIYGEEYTLTENTYYPYVLSSNTEASEQDSLITDTSSKENEITVKQSGYYFDKNLNNYFSSEVYDLLFGESGGCWIASRSISLYDSSTAPMASYGLYTIFGSGNERFWCYGLYNSEYDEEYDHSYVPSYSYRVIVSIDGDTDITVNSGTISDMHTIN